MDLVILAALFGLLMQCIVCQATADFRPTVSTPLGPIEGGIGLTVNDKPYFKFEGVPYAKPPVGNLRFEDPQDPDPWIGTLHANVVTRCIQYDHFTQDFKNNYVVFGDEDCLYLNIYTHSLDANANLDVLLHIHGGAFMFGRGANFGPEIIMDRDVVYVNFNYRLGPLGFLSTEDDVMSGNTGLKDQVKALKWVKENIHYFGGNPNSITLHGLSAGGASVHFHYLLPASKGLFNQGISQSGCTLNPWVIAENVKEKTKKVADLVGCPTDKSEEILKCLKQRPARNIVQTVREFQPYLYNPFSPFGAVVDGQWAKNPTLPDHPYNLLKQGKVQDLPWIVSYTTAEGLYPAADFYADPQHLINIDTKWNEIIPFILHYNETVDPELKNDVSQKIRKFYLGDKPVNKETFSKLVDILSDRLFVTGIETAAKLQSSATKSNVFSYVYNYRASISLSDLSSGSFDNIGVCHGDDTMLLLKMSYYGFPKSELSTKADQKMSQLLLDMTTSFMKQSSPNITEKWSPVSKNPLKPFRILEIHEYDNIKLVETQSVGNQEFWDELPLNENIELENIKVEL